MNGSRRDPAGAVDHEAAADALIADLRRDPDCVILNADQLGRRARREVDISTVYGLGRLDPELERLLAWLALDELLWAAHVATEERLALLLRELRGLSVDEIAWVCGRDRRTISRRIAAAWRKLRTHVRERGHEP